MNLDWNTGSSNNIKLLLIGDRNVGKSSLLTRLSSEQFYEFPKPTMGVDIFVYDMSDELKLQVYDCSGSTRFQSILSPFYNTVDGIIIVYSIDSRSSFEGISNWIKLVTQHVDDKDENVKLLLIGNKSDISKEERQVEQEEGEKMSEKLECGFYETSALNGKNVKESLSQICDEILKSSFYYKKETVWNKRKKKVDNEEGGWVLNVGRKLISCFT